MIEFPALYYDGKTSERRPVRVRGLGSGLHVAGADVNFEVPLAEVSADAPLSGSARILRLPEGAQLHTGDQAAVEALFPRARALETFVHRLERRWPYALGGAALLALAAWWVLVDGLPRAAQFAAGFVPTQVEAHLGAQALELIDARFCKPTKLEAALRAAIGARFAVLTAGLADGYAYRLELRDCGALGANAFALPGGTVVMTDALARLATGDDQLSAVLAHEIGHVRLRHGLRTALQAAGLAALSAAVLGDAVSVTSLAVTVPTAVLQNGYSRSFEADADEYAFRRLKEVGISPAAFADAMELLEKSSKGKAPSSFDYFSTHPATASRIERAREAARQ